MYYKFKEDYRTKKSSNVSSYVLKMFVDVRHHNRMFICSDLTIPFISFCSYFLYEFLSNPASRSPKTPNTAIKYTPNMYI